MPKTKVAQPVLFPDPKPAQPPPTQLQAEKRQRQTAKPSQPQPQPQRRVVAKTRRQIAPQRKPGTVERQSSPSPTIQRQPTNQQVAKLEPPPTNLLAIIARAASSKNVDVAKMRELLTMQREIVAEEARIAFTEAFIGLRLPRIARDGKIDEGTTRSGRQGKKTSYASFENLNNICDPILRDKGFALWFEPDLGPAGHIVMITHLDHVKGHGKTNKIAIGLEDSGHKNPAQAAVSSISYGKRVGMIAILNIQTFAEEDKDRDGYVKKTTEQPAEAAAEDGGVQTITGAQAKTLLKVIDENEINAAVFLDKFHIKAVHELPMASLDEATQVCVNYGKRLREKRAKEPNGEASKDA